MILNWGLHTFVIQIIEVYMNEVITMKYITSCKFYGKSSICKSTVKECCTYKYAQQAAKEVI